MKGWEQGSADFALLSQCGNFGTCVLESKGGQKQELGKGTLRRNKLSPGWLSQGKGAVCLGW